MLTHKIVAYNSMIRLDFSHLSLRTRAIWSEIILPFRKPQIGDHKPVVSSKGRGKIMPEKRAVQKPQLTRLGHYALNRTSHLGCVIMTFYKLFAYISHSTFRKCVNTLSAVLVNQADFTITIARVQLKDSTARIKMRLFWTIRF